MRQYFLWNSILAPAKDFRYSFDLEWMSLAFGFITQRQRHKSKNWKKMWTTSVGQSIRRNQHCINLRSRLGLAASFVSNQIQKYNIRDSFLHDLKYQRQQPLVTRNQSTCKIFFLGWPPSWDARRTHQSLLHNFPCLSQITQRYKRHLPNGGAIHRNRKPYHVSESHRPALVVDFQQYFLEDLL